MSRLLTLGKAVEGRAAAIVDRLEAGSSWAETAEAFGVRPIDVLASLAVDALGGEGRSPLPLVRSAPRRPRLVAALNEFALADFGPTGSAGRPQRLALAAGLLQMVDFWEESHHAAQLADDLGETAFSAYWHGIAHRREPDPGNANYWFRRVGRHPLLEPIAEAVRPILTDAGVSLDEYLDRNVWKPTSLVDLARRARPGSAEESPALELQRVEISVLLDATAQAVGIG